MTEIFFIQHVQTFFASPWARAFVVFCARWAIYLDVVLATVILFSRRSHKNHFVLEAGWAALLAFVMALALNTWIGRLRPFDASSSIALLIPHPLSAYSFPSAHASVAFAIAFTLLFGKTRPATEHASRIRIVGLLSLLVACLVAFGRVASGVHYPSDVIAGACVGLLSFVLVRLGHRALRARDLRNEPSLPA